MHFVQGSPTPAEHFINVSNWFFAAVLVGMLIFVIMLAFVMAW
jgi:hypothetical protein